jgi:transcriptional regulator with PAS, ATPase and Fis domain
MNSIFETLSRALPFFARFSGGIATVLSRTDGARRTVDEQGVELGDYPIEKQEGLAEALASEEPLLIASSEDSNVFNLFVPVEDCLLILKTGRCARLVGKLKSTFEEAVPLIARVAGGEAVLFDREGIRFASVGPDGRDSDKGVGQFTYLGKRAMELRRPVIGPSLLEDGALAVRIPITDEFGIGVNNVVSVKQKKMLAASSRRDRVRYTFADIVGISHSIRSCLLQAKQVAVTGSTVLVSGETGTGKELFVQSIHNVSQQSGGPFIALNCGAIPSSLVESQLFGYDTGAFTGAQKGGQQGLFEQASGGTLFLDEISEMGLELQARLLRVLQERELVRIGGTKVIPVDVRVIASTNRDLWQMVASGQFRQDLYYRLNVVELRVPPLRERIEDIPLLVRHFIGEFHDNFGSFVQDISQEALNSFICYSWPGNVRELRNCIERIMNLTTHEVITIDDIPVIIREGSEHSGHGVARQVRAKPAQPAAGEVPHQDDDLGLTADTIANHPWLMREKTSLKGPAQALERTVIIRALERSAYKRHIAAGMLGISTTTLWRKMKRLGISAGVRHL